MNRNGKARILENLSLNRNHNLLSLRISDEMPEPLPGQFYMLEVNAGNDPLLRRAFSLFRRTPEGIQVLYRVQGKGTALLRDMQKGTLIHLLGPLGNSYPLPAEGEIPLVIAGGVGIASVFPLIERLSKKALVFYGARTKDELFMLDDLRGASAELHLCTDDGSSGMRGTVVDLLEQYLAEGASAGPLRVIYACGPRPMLKALCSTALSRGMKAYVSLEEHMACGVGACLGCVVKTIKPVSEEAGFTYKRVCKEGPVFPAEEIAW